MNNLPKDYIRMCLTFQSLAELFNFIGLVELQEYIYSIDFIHISEQSRLINLNLLQRSKIRVVQDNEVRSKEDSTSKQAHVQVVNKQPSHFCLLISSFTLV